MKTIEAYIISDGRVFQDEDFAAKAESDLLGMELDGLLRLFEIGLSRASEQAALLRCMRRRKELLASIKAIHEILTFESPGL